MRYFFVIFILLSVLPFCDAREVSYLVRSPKALLMGDAYTALADDEYTLFYNPAALAWHENGARVTPLNPDITITNALDSLSKFQDVPSEAADMAEQFMGIPIHVRLGATPGFSFGPFALSLFAATTTNAMIMNASHPLLHMDYKLDRGIVFGYGHSIGGGKNSTTQTAFGASVKRINRAGIDEDFHLLGVSLLNKISEEKDWTELRKSLGYSSGAGWGFDAGVLHRRRVAGGEFSFGLSVLDIMDTTFTKSSGTSDVPVQPMTTAIGAAWQQDFTLFDYRIAMDVNPVLDSIEFARKLHLGVDMGIPLMRFLVGWNGGYLSYGVKFRFWPFTLLVGLYGVEIGAKYHQAKGSRAIIYLSLLDFSFDG